MDWNEIWKIVLCAVGSAGGVGAVIVCSVKFASDIIAERLSQKYEAKLQKELEQYRATLDSKRYISQVRFDKEFEMYQDLSEKNLKMVYDIGQAVKIVRGLYQNNDDIINHDQHLVDSLNDAEFTTKRYAAFIDERLYSKYHELQKKAQIVFKLFDFWCMNENAIFVFRNNLFYISQEMEQYKGYVISEIDPVRGTVTFTNGEVIHTGDVVGDVSEKDMRRIQIRETILSHFEKEEKLYNQGIKTLSLFFIDEVSKYRQYDENGDEVLGEYGQMFEEEYLAILNENLTMFDSAYQRYLRSTADDIARIHKGYFSIDKKTGRSVNSALKRGSEFSDDISAYDLILKNKERLLSFEEPTRFIFSHSALREGWDNPNVFQICTLKHSDSQTAKRQEVGRGLRLCVNQQGNRMDAQTCGDTVHDMPEFRTYHLFENKLDGVIKVAITP